jgi:WD40 repeat protein
MRYIFSSSGGGLAGDGGTATALANESISAGDLVGLVVYSDINPTAITGIIPNDISLTGASAFSPDDNYFAAAGRISPFIYIYKKNSISGVYEKLPDPSNLPKSSVYSCAFSPDGNLLAVQYSGYSPYGIVYGRNGDVFTQIATPRFPSVSNALRFSPDGNWFFVGSTFFKVNNGTFNELSMASNTISGDFTYDSSYVITLENSSGNSVLKAYKLGTQAVLEATSQAISTSGTSGGDFRSYLIPGSYTLIVETGSATASDSWMKYSVTYDPILKTFYQRKFGDFEIARQSSPYPLGISPDGTLCVHYCVSSKLYYSHLYGWKRDAFVVSADSTTQDLNVGIGVLVASVFNSAGSLMVLNTTSGPPVTFPVERRKLVVRLTKETIRKYAGGALAAIGTANAAGSIGSSVSITRISVLETAYGANTSLLG